MRLLQCAEHGYTIKANFDIETRHPGRLEVQDGAIVVHLGGRSLSEYVPLSDIQRAYCMICGVQLEVVTLDDCPHETDDQFWKAQRDNNRPTRTCTLCGFREVGVYVPVWPE